MVSFQRKMSSEIEGALEVGNRIQIRGIAVSCNLNTPKETFPYFFSSRLPYLIARIESFSTYRKLISKT